MNPSAIIVMKRELRRIQQAEAECVDQYGIIKNAMKYKYQLLVKKASSFKHAIDWMETQTNCK